MRRTGEPESGRSGEREIEKGECMDDHQGFSG
jgi:hypothetical protein